MLTKRVLFGAFAAAGVLALSACATTGDESASTGQSAMSARHSHMRDAKQGGMEPAYVGGDTEVKKPLHDHRQWKGS